MEIEEYVAKFEGFYKLSASEQIPILAYYQTEISDNGTQFKPNDIKVLFEVLDLLPYSNISRYCTNKAGGKRTSRLFTKSKHGYSLLKNCKDLVLKSYNPSKVKTKVTADLKSLSAKISDPDQNEFLKELLKCHSIGAYRATIIMIWNLSLDQLFEHILSKKLSQFNSALSANTDRRVKITVITKKDDFGEIPEGKFIEFCRTSRIISNDVRKILEANLGVRNSAAHPSNISFAESKTLSIVEELINNVIIKYKS